MKKKINIKTVIRKIVREEVATAIQEVISELKQPIKNTKTSKENMYSGNSIINDVLNETVNDTKWEDMGNGKFDSSRMNEVMASQYGDLMNNDPTKIDPDAMIASMGINPNEISQELKDNMFNKDYSKLLKKIDEKSKI